MPAKKTNIKKALPLLLPPPPNHHQLREQIMFNDITWRKLMCWTEREKWEFFSLILIEVFSGRNYNIKRRMFICKNEMMRVLVVLMWHLYKILNKFCVCVRDAIIVLIVYGYYDDCPFL